MIGPTWPTDDMLRVEHLLISAAGSSSDGLVSEASTHLIKAGGKRLRPALVLLTSRAGRAGTRATDLAAAAVELVHLATLYHDDVIDDSDTRRGVPTVHAKWGTEVAVLAGDYLFARGCALGAEAGGEVPGILARAIGEVCEGQIAETSALNDPERRAADYTQTIVKKTASLFAAACELGAITSDATPETTAALTAYGAELGLAFQIVDDLLDLVGDPDQTGKVPGTDLQEGVFTLPVLIACERDPSLVAALASGHRELGEIMPSLEATGALGAAHEVAGDHGRAALGAIAHIPEAEWTAALRHIVSGVLAQVPPGPLFR
jgi:heptaprenyl diphosphate synthase